jgi:hypothetical protein
MDCISWKIAPAGVVALLLVVPGLSAAQAGRAALIRMQQQQAAQLESRATPRTADGHPDLSGNWTSQDQAWAFIHPQIDSKGDICFAGCTAAPARPTPARPRPTAAVSNSKAGAAAKAAPLRNFPDYKPQFQAEVTNYQHHLVASDPILHACANPGLPRVGPPNYILQTPRMVVFLYTNVNGNYWRVIPMDGAPHDANADPSPLGDSVGRWDGDTLVVESENFTPDTWLTDYGAFHTDDLRVVERITRKGDVVIYQSISYDPAVLAKPWTQQHVLTPVREKLQPSSPCIEKDMTKMRNDAYHPNPP